MFSKPDVGASNKANASPRSLRSTSAPVSLAVVQRELNQVQVTVQDVTEDITTLTIKVSEGRRLLDDLSLQLRSLRTEYNELRSFHENILETLTDLRDETNGEHQRVSGADGKSSRMSAGIPTAMPIVKQEFRPPAFNPKANRFYVVLVGKCPGVYSNFYWTKKLTSGLPGGVDAVYNRVDSYEEAIAAYEEGASMNMVQFAGRNYPADAAEYGPMTPFKPWDTR
ncbi:hypothetical protein BJ165DRAFT_1532197 [Panaeolus papilionaceus]|nr:hypothetical protein BJ165DRAFT_1532197 [Panaeolus papilionaceus]